MDFYVERNDEREFAADAGATSQPANWWLERLPLVVLMVCVAFLQGYGLRFWGGLLGGSGWGVSVGLEVLHIWFWYRAALDAVGVDVGGVAR